MGCSNKRYQICLCYLQKQKNFCLYFKRKLQGFLFRQFMIFFLLFNHYVLNFRVKLFFNDVLWLPWLHWRAYHYQVYGADLKRQKIFQFLFTSFDHVEKHWIAEHIKEKKFLAYSDGYQIFGLTKWTFFNDSKVPLNKQITITKCCFSFVQ